MRNLIRILAPAGLAVAMAAAGGTTALAGTTTGGTPLNAVGYSGYYDVTITQTVVSNSSWKIINGTMTITAANGYQGYVSVVTFTQKTPQGEQKPSSLTGSVTSTNPYGGPVTKSWAATSDFTVPFGANTITNPTHIFGGVTEPAVYAGTEGYGDAYAAWYYLAYGNGGPGIVGEFYGPAFGDLCNYYGPGTLSTFCT